jgi:hypothetical protein
VSETPVHKKRRRGLLRSKVKIKSLSDLDLRCKAGQRALQLRNSLVSDIGGDPTTAQREVCQRAAVLGAMLENYEVRWLNGDQIDEAKYVSLANCQRKNLDALGFERKPRDITPTLTDYLKMADDPMDLDTQEEPSGRPESS